MSRVANLISLKEKWVGPGFHVSCVETICWLEISLCHERDVHIFIDKIFLITFTSLFRFLQYTKWLRKYYLLEELDGCFCTNMTSTGGDVRDEFFIGRDKGNVLLAKQLDWERQREYNLTISVTDGVHTVYTQVSGEMVLINIIFFI